MNETERQLQDLERDEHWLRGVHTPGPDEVTLERVKYVIRRACEGDSAEQVGAGQATMTAKRAVRRELFGDRSLSRPGIARRHWIIRLAPALTAAAAIAMAVVVLRDVPPSVEAQRETVLSAFAETLEDEPAGIDAELADIASDVLDLESAWASAGQEDDFGALLDDINDAPGDTTGENDSF